MWALSMLRKGIAAIVQLAPFYFSLSDLTTFSMRAAVEEESFSQAVEQ